MLKNLKLICRPPAALLPPSCRPPAALLPPPSCPPAALQLPSCRPPAALLPPPSCPPAAPSCPPAALLPPPSCPPAALQFPSCRPPAALLPPSCCPPAALLLPSCRPPAALLLPSSFPPAALPSYYPIYAKLWDCICSIVVTIILCTYTITFLCSTLMEWTSTTFSFTMVIQKYSISQLETLVPEKVEERKASVPGPRIYFVVMCPDYCYISLHVIII